MVYILVEIVTMLMLCPIYQQYQRNLLQAKVGLPRFFIPPQNLFAALLVIN